MILQLYCVFTPRATKIVKSAGVIRFVCRRVVGKREVAKATKAISNKTWATRVDQRKLKTAQVDEN